MINKTVQYLVNSFGSYFLLPMYFATTILFIFFNIPYTYYFGIFSLLAIITIPILSIKKVCPIKLNILESYNVISQQKKYQLLISLFCIWIIFSGLIDIYVNGFKLLNPSSYGTFDGIGRYIRHNSSLCWMLIPIAFIYFQKWKIKFALISYAVFFPILIIDRNRLFISFYSLLLCVVCSSSSLRLFKKEKLSIAIGGIIICCFVLFIILGILRGSSSFTINSSGVLLVKNQYPLTSIFMQLSSSMQQFIIYITSPLFNFATIVANEFRNPEFLLSQLSPFHRENFSLYSYAPILISDFNVGTEFYPFLLYGGLIMVLVSYIVMVVIFYLFCYLFKKTPNIFTFLIFIKLSYTILLMGFGPQFYILYNFGAILLVLLLWAVSVRYEIFIRQIKLFNLKFKYN